MLQQKHQCKCQKEWKAKGTKSEAKEKQKENQEKTHSWLGS
jgi:hypothetical protein